MIQDNTFKVFILAYPYTHLSNGTRVLYKLQNLLIRSGFDCIILTHGFIDHYIKNRVIGKNDIVIYCENIKGNPLQANKVVRYLLNVPEFFNLTLKDFGTNEYTIAYNLKHSYLSSGKYLAIPTTESFFKNYNKTRLYNACWVYKAILEKRNKPIIFQPNTIEITKDFPATRISLAEFLNQTNILYTFDKLTVLTYEAYLCGCNVIYIDENNIQSPVDFSDIKQFETWKECYKLFINDLKNL